MKLYNTLKKAKQEFKPLNPDVVKLYTCGPTVYDNLHIGNWRNQIFYDTLTRTLSLAGYTVNRVMNITDVGHLVSDADEGMDKLDKGAKREGKSAWDVARHYTTAYYHDAERLGIHIPTTVIKATEAIDSQVGLIQILLEKGFAYKAEQAIYFDVTKLQDYGKLSGQNLADKQAGTRKGVVADPAKHHPQDFAVWFFTVGHFADHEMRWPSPWGEGFPGWHLECSAIIHQALGEPIDIHTGGIDHIGTHHTNEIAQSEAAFGKPLANYWVHNEFLQINGQRMGKSLDNFFTVNHIVERGFVPMALKLLCLQAHYRTQQNFTWAALESAQNALASLYAWSDLQFQNRESEALEEHLDELFGKIKHYMEDDLNTPMAYMAMVGMVACTDTYGANSLAIGHYTKKLDAYFGLELSNRRDITSAQKDLVAKRQAARQNKHFDLSDSLRDELMAQGIEIEDTAKGPRWWRAR